MPLRIVGLLIDNAIVRGIMSFVRLIIGILMKLMRNPFVIIFIMTGIGSLLFLNHDIREKFFGPENCKD